jgi:hypothetical protein
MKKLILFILILIPILVYNQSTNSSENKVIEPSIIGNLENTAGYYLDSTSTAQTKSGDLTVNEMTSTKFILNDSTWITHNGVRVYYVVNNDTLFTIAADTFDINGNIHLGINKPIILDDDGDTKIYAPTDDEIYVYTGGGLRIKIENGGVIFNQTIRPYSNLAFNLGNNSYYYQGVYTDRLYIDADTYIDYSGTDTMDIYVGGVLAALYGENGGTIHYRNYADSAFFEGYIVTDSVVAESRNVYADTIIIDWKTMNLIKYSLQSRKQGHLLDLQSEKDKKATVTTGDLEQRIEGNVAVNERQQIWLFRNRLLILLLAIWNLVITYLIIKKYK